MRCFSRAWWCSGAIVLSACAAQEPTLVASNCEQPGGCLKQALHLDSVDVLMVIDDSSSIAPRAEQLKQQLPRMLSALTTGTDGDASFPPAKSVHVAVTTTDMGAGNDAISFCKGTGQDGYFVRPGSVGVTCAVSYPGYLNYDGGPAALSVVDSAACVPLVFAEENRGNGCGFEQPLEAALKAVWPGDNHSIQFAQGSGHADDDTNRGFLRDDSLLVVIVVTDEDDCSAQDLSLFAPASEDPNAPDINLRCHFGGDKLYGVQRYVDSLKHVRPDNDNVIFAVVAGVPAELVSDDFRARYDLTKANDAQRYYDDVLAAPLMQEQVVNPMDGTGHVAPSCAMANGETIGLTTPPRRLVEVARGFGVNSVLGSLCTDGFGTTMGHLIRAVGEKLSR